MRDLTNEFDRLARAYEDVEQCVQHIATGAIRSLIINGPPGVGKSYMVNQFLAAYKTEAHQVVTGHMTNLSLYHALYTHRNPGQVLVLDDVDSVFSKIDGLNLLKAAMDTAPRRLISWASSTNLLNTLQVPTTFEFKGSVILITNVGFGGNGGKLVAHLKALADRSFIIKIADGGRESAFAQVAFMVLEKALLSAYNLRDGAVDELLSFLYENLEQLNTVSLRTATKLADLYTLQPTTWKRTALTSLIGAKQ